MEEKEEDGGEGRGRYKEVRFPGWFWVPTKINN